jgi:hypothetical protein
MMSVTSHKELTGNVNWAYVKNEQTVYTDIDSTLYWGIWNILKQSPNFTDLMFFALKQL